jgi:NAD(P)-dependent dehydrogenase (short-subunit alcohol dehydrogenase family)
MIKEKFDLSGKVALVVGGRGYLGSRFSMALAECGARVYSADLPQNSYAAQKDTNPASGKGIEQRDIDVTNPNSVTTMVNNMLLETSRIDVLVYSVTAKPTDFYASFTECSLEGWQMVVRAEMDGLFLVTQRIGRVMEKAKSGSIILLSSIYGIVGNDQRIYEGSNLAQLYANDQKTKRVFAHASYSAVKGAVISLTRYLAAYWEGKNIRVNCISPGGVVHPGENDEFVRRYSERVPLGRKASIDEILGAVVFLASDAASYVNGHNLVVDGGWTIW